jgi:uncharacterized protein YdaU (DUF1376 family)
VEKVDVFMPFFVADYLRDTGDLSLEEHGAYVLLLIHMWGRGRLPADHARLARVVGVDVATFGRLWPGLSRFFEPDEEVGFITQKRLAFELEEARRRKKAASDSGKKSAEVRRQQRNGNDPTNDLGNDLANETATTLVADAQPKSNSSSPSSSSSSSGSPASASPASSARARDPSATEQRPPALPGTAPAAAGRPKWRSGYEWLEAFRLAWREVYHRHYGNTSDGNAVRDLEDLVLAHMPNDEGEGLWAQRVAFFQRFLANRDPRVVQGKHAFVLLVTRFSDFRPDVAALGAPEAGAGSPDRPCDFHAGGANQGKAAAKNYQKPRTCAECRHLQARASPRAASEPNSVADLVSSLMPGR